MGCVRWRVRHRTVEFDTQRITPKTRGVMGILNVTPDSFSDGGAYVDPDAALKHAINMVEEGALIIDVGGESSRPGATPVSASEELRRVVPVIERIRAVSDVLISIDTVKSEVASAAIAAGADIVNDISACRADSEMFTLVRETGVGVILMHMRGTPQTMQTGNLASPCIVTEVLQFFEERVAAALAVGIDLEHLCLDPGIGFGKTSAQNFSLCRSLRTMEKLGRPILFGISRKSCLGSLVERVAEERDAASLVSDVWALQQGASMLRVHNVPQTRDALRVWQELTKGE